MEHTVRVKLLGTAAVLALGIGASIVTSTIVVSRSIEQRSKIQARGAQSIGVKGSARQRVVSDMGVWDISVSGDAPTLQQAYAVLEDGVTRVQKYLGEAGFAPGEVELSAIDTETHYKRDAKGEPTREVGGYTLKRMFTIATPSVQRVQKAAGDVTTLLKEGVRVSSAQPKYSYAKLADLKVQILGDAAKDARTRAEEIVKNTGGRIGAVKDVQMGVMQITRPNSTDVAGYGLYDTTTIEKDITAVVTVTFGVEN
jgi:uncharacterized protein